MLSHQPKDVGHAKIIEMVLRELNGEPSVKSARPLPSDIFTSLKSSEPYYSLPKGNLLTRYLIKTDLFKQFGFGDNVLVSSTGTKIKIASAAMNYEIDTNTMQSGWALSPRVPKTIDLQCEIVSQRIKELIPQFMKELHSY